MSVSRCGLVGGAKASGRLIFAIATVLLCATGEGIAEELIGGELQTPPVFSGCDVGDVCLEEYEPENAAVYYEYYEGIWNRLPDFEQLTPVSTGAYPFISLEPARRPDNFGFRFNTQLNIESSGEYTLYLTSDDGSALYIDGSRLIDNDGLQQASEQSVTLDLEVGLYPLSVLYFEKSGAESLLLEIAGPQLPRQSITAFLVRESPAVTALTAEATTPVSVSAPQVKETNSPAAESTASINAGESEIVSDNESPAIADADSNNPSNKPQKTSPVEETEVVNDDTADARDLKPEEPSRPGLFEVDEDAAERALERSLVLLDALLLAPGKVDVGLDISYGVDTQSEPVLVVVTDDETGTTSDAIGVEEATNRRTGVVLDLRFGLPRDSQINFSAPFSNTEIDTNLRLAGSAVESQSESSNESGPFSIGLVKTLFKEKGRIPDLIASVNYSDGGDSQEAAEFSACLLYTSPSPRDRG